MKIRSDSLFAKLTPAQREELFSALCVESKSYADAAAMCSAWNVTTSIGALHKFYSQHSFAWRVAEAKASAEAMDATIPQDLEVKTRALLKQRQFEIALGNLTINELEALAKMDVNARAQTLRENIEPEKLKVMQRRCELLEKKMSEVTDAATNPKLTPEERAAKINEIFGIA